MQRPIALLWTLLLVTSLALVGCPRPLSHAVLSTALGPSPAGLGQKVTLAGRIGPSGRQSQANLSTIGVGATVSLIDTMTNDTVASTISDGGGSFVLTSLSPVPGRSYYLEAEKGLPVEFGGEPNRAGHPGARIRTIVRYASNKGWETITQGGITIDYSTTALSVILSLRSAQDASTRPVEDALFNSLALSASIGNPDTFTPGMSRISQTEFAQVETMVRNALGTDNDPMAIISFDTASGAYYLAQRGISVSRVFPTEGPLGTVVTIDGSNLSAAPLIRFNGTQVPADQVSVNDVQTSLVVRVPVGATSGPLTVQVGSLVYNGTNFAVHNWDGHNIFDKAGNMYVAGFNDNAIWKFTPDGRGSILVQDPTLNQPRGVAFDPWNNLYVTSWGNKAVYKIDVNTGAITTYAQNNGLNQPWGLAFNGSGDLFVANYGGQNVLKIATSSTLPIVPTVYATQASAGLDRPSRLAFDLNEYLYVSNWNGGTLSRIAPDGTGGPLAGGMSNPGGVAIDSSGNVFVAAQGNNMVYKVTADGQLQRIVSLPNYDDSLAFNPDGTLYVAGHYYPYIAHINSAGRVLGYFSAGHLPYSIAIDPVDGTMFMTSGQGWGNNSQLVSKLTWNAGTGTYDNPVTLAKDLPNPSALAIHPVSRDVYIGDWTGLVFQANRSTGANASVVGGLGAIGAMAFNRAGDKLFVAGWGNHRVYQVEGNTVTKSWGNWTNWANMIKGPDGAYYIPDYNNDQVLRLQNGVMSVYAQGSPLLQPMGLAFDSLGYLYVGCWDQRRVVRIAPGTHAITTYKSGLADTVAGLVFDASDNLYITQWNNRKVQQIATGSLAVTDIATIPSNCRGLVRRPNGDLLVSSWYDQKIYRIASGATSATEYATVARSPWGMDLDANGDLYVACYDDGMVMKVAYTGDGSVGGGVSVVTASGGNVAGIVREAGATVMCRWDGTQIFRIADGSTTLRPIGQGLWTPSGIAVDASNERYLYVNDWSVGSIIKIDTQLDSWEVVGYTRDWPLGSDNLVGLTFGSDGKLYASSWSRGVYQLDTAQLSASNVLSASAAGVSFYGGNRSDGGIRGGIAFGPAGVLYGTTWDWMRNSCSILEALPAGGLPVDVKTTHVPVWPNYATF